MAFTLAAAAVPIRLLTATDAAAGMHGRSTVYRPLIVGPALLVRSPDGGPWEVEVDDTTLAPLGCDDGSDSFDRIARYRAQGFRCRLAATLVSPGDTCRRPRHAGSHGRGADRPEHRPLEMYGWALMYQLPDANGIATVDPHDHHPDLPAFFELPQELIDRSDHLARYGIPSRPLALITAASDFDRTPDGQLRNRFASGARFTAARGFIPV